MEFLDQNLSKPIFKFANLRSFEQETLIKVKQPLSMDWELLKDLFKVIIVGIHALQNQEI